ncbi:MAG: phosphatase PAP2 family protein [Vulcanimicrobiaceae bacterium]
MDILIRLIAEWGLLVPAACVAIVTLLRRRWFTDIADGASGGLATIVLVKISGALYDEPRPFVVEHIRPLIPHIADNAFPSDHLAATGLAFAYLWPRSKPLAVLVFVMALLIGSARVLAHLHWPLDVTVGFMLGVIGLFAGNAIVRAIPALHSRMQPPRPR